MLNGTFAQLLERSLRLDARSWSPHLARFGLMGAIYISLCMIRLERAVIGAPGLQFFQVIATFDAFFMTLLGISFFSSAITEEKEEDTLGLMVMAGISPIGILAGKSGGRLWQAMLLVAVQYPFTLLAVTMGGVTSDQIWAMTVTLLAYMIFLAGLGLLCSTVRRSQTSGIFMIAGLIVYFGLPIYARSVAWLHTTGRVYWTQSLGISPYWWSWIDRFGDVCVFYRMQTILASGFHESAISVQVVTNLCAGLVCAVLSWLLFGMATRSPSTESSSRGLVSSRAGFLRFPAGRAWGNPFVWKDFFFTSGGIWMLLIRVAFYIGLGLVILLFEQSFSFRSLDFWVQAYLMWIMFLLPVDAAILVSRSMQDEVRGQTIASLAMLPRSTNRIVYSKLAGAMMGWLPGPIIGLSVLLFSEAGQRSLRNTGPNNEQFWVIPIIFCFFALVPHYAAVMALYVRWGAVPLGIGLTVGTYVGIICVAMLVGPIAGGPPMGPGSMQFHLIMAFMLAMLLLLNAACHLAMLLRIHALSAK